MRKVAAVLVCLAGLSAGPAGAVNPPVIGTPLPGTAGATSSHAKSPGALRLTVDRFPLVCGRPLGVVKVVLPKATKLPRRIARAAVRLNGTAALRVAVAGRTVSVTPRFPKGITCHSISAGRLTLVIARTAGVRLGTTRARTVPVRHGARVYRGLLRLSS